VDSYTTRARDHCLLVSFLLTITFCFNFLSAQHVCLFFSATVGWGSDSEENTSKSEDTTDTHRHKRQHSPVCTHSCAVFCLIFVVPPRPACAVEGVLFWLRKVDWTFQRCSLRIQMHRVSPSPPSRSSLFLHLLHPFSVLSSSSLRSRSLLASSSLLHRTSCGRDPHPHRIHSISHSKPRRLFEANHLLMATSI
jgi:hypothetical protein